MWERMLGEFIGLDGTIRRVAGFRMRKFSTVGQTVTVRGRVARKWREEGGALLELEVWSEAGEEVTVGPGTVTVTLPASRRGEPA